MKIMVVGAGAMGGSFAGLLAVSGHEVRIIDTDSAHVEAINRDGLLVEGVLGVHLGAGLNQQASHNRVPPVAGVGKCGHTVFGGGIYIRAVSQKLLDGVRIALLGRGPQLPFRLTRRCGNRDQNRKNQC